MPDEQTITKSKPNEPPESHKPARAIRWRRRPNRLLILLAVLGPGLISAAAGDDAGGIATYAQAGASYGYQLLWVMVIITISLAVVQEMCARMGAITQKGLSDLIREEFGVRWTAFAMLCLLIANGSTVVTEFLGIKASVQVLAGEDTWLVYPVVPLVAFGVWWLVIKGSYRRVEIVFLLMALALVSYVPAAFLAKPDWGQVVHQTFIPSFSLAGGYIATLVATIGTTITPYMQVYQQSAVVDKGIQPKEYIYEVVDVYSSSILGNLVSYFIIVATGATLFLSHITVSTAGDAARALEPLAGPAAKYLFAVGLFGASMLAAAVLPLSTSYAVCEAFGFERGVSRSFKEAPVFQSIFTGLIVLGVLIALIPGLPIISVLINLQILNAILLPVLLLFILRLVNNRRLMGRYANGRVYNLIAWATTIGVSAMAILYIIISLVLPLLGISLGG
jgi:Mn2+/Fe2+ NRAMP family transporter